MRVLVFGDQEISARPLASELALAWVVDNREWGAAVTAVIERRRIRSSIVSVNMTDLCFEWAGPALTYLDEDPARLYNQSITALPDQRFAEGVVADLRRATAAPRPSLCRIDTPLNGVDVSYELLSLPIFNPRAGKIISCLRVPLTLTVKAPPPAGFNALRCPLKTTFAPD